MIQKLLSRRAIAPVSSATGAIALSWNRRLPIMVGCFSFPLIVVGQMVCCATIENRDFRIGNRHGKKHRNQS